MSTEPNNGKAQEQELWDRISTTEGAERAEVLDELSHIAYKKDNFIECLNLVDTSIDIYFKQGGLDIYLTELIHLYHGKVHCFENLKRYEDAARTHEELAVMKFVENDFEAQAEELRAAGRAWYRTEEWRKSLDNHLAAKAVLDPSITTLTMGVDLLNIGMALAKLGSYQDAVDNYLSARSLCKEAKNPEFVGWCDNYLALSYIALNNGPEAKFHALHYFNYTKVTEDLGMEAYSRYRLGAALLLCEEYEEAEKHLVRSLELLTLDEDKDWEDIVAVNKQLAQALTALNREAEAQKRLDRIKTIEETIAA
ncbi:tetratricopeptide repeat protein [Candidatus Planktophila versatilis]|uniref:Tetratricopeptide repeat-containing protein n=1 Tax=Candidatus Planktophila versatilis TaxID=1884905 RepID=A0ABN5BCU3_9ACTN|nr:tetratricopeptide repeat protein [Candidatus Planktophila versatilis]ASY17029.1 Tetratricopeptide repeat-containing protein [Candidatus Planktophila versatilis]